MPRPWTCGASSAIWNVPHTRKKSCNRNVVADMRHETACLVLLVQHLRRPEMSSRASTLSMAASAGGRVPSQGSAALPAIIAAKLEGDTSLPNRGRLRRHCNAPI